jgi:hypothetical protein
VERFEGACVAALAVGAIVLLVAAGTRLRGRRAWPLVALAAACLAGTAFYVERELAGPYQSALDGVFGPWLAVWAAVAPALCVALGWDARRVGLVALGTAGLWSAASLCMPWLAPTSDVGGPGFVYTVTLPCGACAAWLVAGRMRLVRSLRAAPAGAVRAPVGGRSAADMPTGGGGSPG